MNGAKKPVSFTVAAATILLAIMLYDVMGAIVKHLSEGYPSQQLSFFRNLFGLVPTLLILFWSRTWVEAGRPIRIKQWKLALARGGVGALAQLCFYVAVFHLEFATATTILFAGPMFVTALSVPVLGHKVGLVRWSAVVIGFAGVVLVMQPNAPSFTWYAVLPMLAAFGYASISVTSRLFDAAIPTALINLYQTTGALIGALALVAFTGGFTPVAHVEDWFWLGAMGVAGGLAAFCLITAYRLADPSSLSPFEYFAIPFSFGLGWIFFSEAPFDRLLPGAILIVGGGMFVIWRERSGKRALEARR